MLIFSMGIGKRGGCFFSNFKEGFAAQGMSNIAYKGSFSSVDELDFEDELGESSF